MKSYASILILALFLGCHTPETSKILGTPWPTEKVTGLRGWWMNPGTELCRISPKKDGTGVVVACLDRETDDKGFAIVNTDCTFTRIGGSDFVFGKNLNIELYSEGFRFALIRSFDKDRIVIGNPDGDVFLELVETGKLLGEIRNLEDKKKRWPIIHAEADAFIAAIEAAGIDRCFPKESNQELIRQLTTKD
jgi:hypothetical protein